MLGRMKEEDTLFASLLLLRFLLFIALPRLLGSLDEEEA